MRAVLDAGSWPITSRRTVHGQPARHRHGASTPRLKSGTARCGRGVLACRRVVDLAARQRANRRCLHAGMPSRPHLISERFGPRRPCLVVNLGSGTAKAKCAAIVRPWAGRFAPISPKFIPSRVSPLLASQLRHGFNALPVRSTRLARSVLVSQPTSRGLGSSPRPVPSYAPPIAAFGERRD